MYTSGFTDAIGFLLVLAIIGLIALGVGATLLIWWLITHVSIVLV